MQQMQCCIYSNKKGVLFMHIGIDLGGTNIAIGVVQNGKIIRKCLARTMPDRNNEEIIADISEMVKNLVSDVGAVMDDIECIGIGSPGIPDIREGVLKNVVNISNVPIRIREEMQKYIDKPIYVENDARCAAIGELEAGAAKGSNNAVMITLGTGVGSGIIINGKIYSGCQYGAGEIGHTVIQVDGIPCKCGREGCLEQYASVTGLVRMAKEAILNNPESGFAKESEENEIDGEFVCDMAHKDDALAVEIMDNYIKYVSVGVANIVNIFQPEVIVIGGGISQQGDYLLNPIREYVSRNVITKDMMVTEIRQALLGNDAGIIGAAMCSKYQEI